jgi:hypothetical protein
LVYSSRFGILYQYQSGNHAALLIVYGLSGLF